MKKGRLIVAASLDCSDLLYASGFKAPDPFIYYSRGRSKGIIVSSLEHGRAIHQAKSGVKVHHNIEFFGKNSESWKTPRKLIELSEYLGVDHWEVPGDFPLKLADNLRKSGINVTSTDQPFFPRRERKAKSEVKQISNALRVAEHAMNRAIEVLREASVDSRQQLVWQDQTLTSELLRAEIDVDIARNGGTASDTIVACGPQGAEPHNTGSGPLKAAQPIIIDIFPRMDATGYWGDLTRTMVKGTAPKQIKKAFEAVREARNQAKKKIKAGVKASDVYQRAFDILTNHGFRTGRKKGRDFGFIHGLGHGVGLDIHESPRLSPLSHTPLAPGNVVTVEPGVYYPEWGGIRLEDLVVVRKKSCEGLNNIKTFLEIP